jgi:hypothetical protein
LELSVSKCQVVLDVFPEGRASMDALPLTVIRPAGLSSNQLLNGIRQAMSSKPQQRPAAMPILGRNEIRFFIRQRDSNC